MSVRDGCSACCRTCSDRRSCERIHRTVIQEALAIVKAEVAEDRLAVAARMRQIVADAGYMAVNLDG